MKKTLLMYLLVIVKGTENLCKTVVVKYSCS